MSNDFLKEESENIFRTKQMLLARLLEFDLTVDKLFGKGMCHYFVSGGCFASYLQGNLPKDIDIYFTDEVYAKPVVNLYTNDSAYTNQVAVWDEKYREVRGTAGDMCITENAVTLKNRLQLITKHYGQPKDIRATFDFVHCMPYYDSRDGKLYISREQYNCCVNKCLMVNNRINLTYWREEKFKKRGYEYGNFTNNNISTT